MSHQNNSNHILIIDDNQFVLEITTEILNELGVETFTATSGPAGIQLFKNHLKQIALVILDMMMPGMNGRETLKILRQINPNVPVILSSGFLGKGVNLNQLDVDGFVHKPYSIDDLIAKVRTVSDIAI